MKLKLNNNNTKEILKLTLKILKQGGLVIFPSDTVYGALVDATNEKAVKKLIEFKNRPPGKAISVFVADFEMIKDQAAFGVDEEKTLRNILPGPFTIVLPSKHKVNKLLESEKGTLGVRLPKYFLIVELTKRFGKPITATSANLGGKSPHYSVESLLKQFPEKKKNLIDLIVDAGKLPRNKPSTIIDMSTSDIKILRRGDVEFSLTNKFISRSPEETKAIAKNIVAKIKERDKPIVFIIEGELGVGKTVFVKGIGDFFGIKNIISPTFVVYYEYEVKLSKFIHLDLYNLKEKEEFNHLGIEKLLKPGNIFCFEWGEKAGEIYELLKSKAKIVYIKMKYVNEEKREIVINK